MFKYIVDENIQKQSFLKWDRGNYKDDSTLILLISLIKNSTFLFLALNPLLFYFEFCLSSCLPYSQILSSLFFMLLVEHKKEKILKKMCSCSAQGSHHSLSFISMWNATQQDTKIRYYIWNFARTGDIKAIYEERSGKVEFKLKFVDLKALKVLKYTKCMVPEKWKWSIVKFVTRPFTYYVTLKFGVLTPTPSLCNIINKRIACKNNIL